MWRILILYTISNPLITMTTVQSSCVPSWTEKRPEDDHPYRFLPTTTWPETATLPNRRTYIDPDRLRRRNNDKKSEADYHPRVKRMAVIDDCTRQRWSDEEARRREKEEELIEWMRRRTRIYNYRFSSSSSMAAEDSAASPLHEGGPPPEEGWRPPWIHPSLLLPTTTSTSDPQNQNDDFSQIESETTAPPSSWQPFSTTPSSNFEHDSKNSTSMPQVVSPSPRPTQGSLGSQGVGVNVTGSGSSGNLSELAGPTTTKVPVTIMPTKIPDKTTTKIPTTLSTKIPITIPTTVPNKTTTAKIPITMPTTKIPTTMPTKIPNKLSTKIPTVTSTVTSWNSTARPGPSSNSSITMTTSKKPVFTNGNLAPAWPSSPGPSFPVSPNITLASPKPQLNSTVSLPIPVPTNSSAATVGGGVSSEQTTVSDDFESIDEHEAGGQIAGDGVCSCIIRHHNWEQRKILEAKIREEEQNKANE